MAKLANNQRSIDAVKSGVEREYHTVDGCPGLQLDVLPSGVKTWRVYTRDQAGKKVMRTIGPADAITVGRAADEARKFIETAKLGDLAVKIETRPTFADLFERWYVYTEQHKKASSRTEDRRLYDTLIKPRLGTSVVGFAPGDRQVIITALDAIARDHSPLQANRAQAVISAALSFSLDEGLTEMHPAARIRKRGAENSRSPEFTTATIATIWRDAEDNDANVQDVIRLLMLLGLRRSEVAELERREVDLEARVISIRAERRKAWRIGDPKTPHVVPLKETALAIVKAAIERAHESEFVFPNRTLAKVAPMSADNVTARFRAIVRKGKLGDFRLHDLRHMVKTGMTSLGVPPFVADRVQDHAPDRGSGTRYDRYSYLAEKGKALALWQSHLLAIVKGKPVPPDRW